MKIQLWGTKVVLRVFERVETTNQSFAIYDVGIGYTTSDCVDSVAVGIGSSFIHPDNAVTPEMEQQVHGTKPADTTPDQDASSDEESSDEDSSSNDEEPAPEPVAFTHTEQPVDDVPLSDDKPASEAVVAVASHDPDAAPDLEELERSLKDSDDQIARLTEDDLLSMSFT